MSYQRPDTSRNKDLAGKSVRQGNWTVSYDSDGYATMASNDGGKSANHFVKTTHANDSPEHQEAYQAAQQGNWDAVGVALGKLGMKTPNEHGGYDMGAANQYWRELTDEFNYNANDYYGVPAAGGWDGAAKATANPASGSQYAASVQWSADSQEDLIRKLAAAQKEAAAAELRTCYEQSLAESRQQDDLISKAAYNQRNQIAGQNDLQRLLMAETGAAQGLNTGAAGQLALAQNVALQGNLAALGAQEARSLADNGLYRAQLGSQLRGDLARSSADIDAWMYGALLQEQERARTLAYQEQQQARSEARDLAMLSIQNGVLPDAALLETAGLDPETAKTLAQLYYNAAAVSAPAAAPYRADYDNGSLSTEQIKLLQRHINQYLDPGEQIAVDGKWGPETAAAAAGMTANEYINIYYKQNAWSGRPDR